MIAPVNVDVTMNHHNGVCQGPDQETERERVEIDLETETELETELGRDVEIDLEIGGLERGVVVSGHARVPEEEGGVEGPTPNSPDLEVVAVAVVVVADVALQVTGGCHGMSANVDR